MNHSYIYSSIAETRVVACSEAGGEHACKIAGLGFVDHRVYQDHMVLVKEPDCEMNKAAVDSWQC
jgi:hypothetical protein